MQIGLLINALPAWALFLLIVMICMLSAKAGTKVAQHRVREGKKEPDAPVGTAVGAILGLLAFMLGFTFSLTESRFGKRNDLVIREANAISTCYLQTSFLPEKQKLATRAYFKEYIEILVQPNVGTINKKALARLDELHLLMWNQAVSLMQTEMDWGIRSLYISSLSNMIDLTGERKIVGLVFRIPDIIWTSLFLLCAFSMFAIGYQIGTYHTRRTFGIPLLAAAFAIVMVLIAEMDSTGGGRFKVNLQPLREVREMMLRNNP